MNFHAGMIQVHIGVLPKCKYSTSKSHINPFEFAKSLLGL